MDLFENEPTGVLVSLEEDAHSGYIYNVWFPYTRANIRGIHEGNFIGVKNFEGLDETPKYSVLEIISVLPVHYALGATARDTERAFPGFVVEAAKSARQDWEQEVSTEQTTKIRTSAIPTNIQITSTSPDYILEPDESMPMIGEEVFLLTNDTTNRVINQNLSDEAVPHIEPCCLVQNDEINVCISTEDLLRTHFGVFGFTGSGKSNLLSTIIANLSEINGLKIVLFDLMLEYTGLLIDLLTQMDDAFILCLDPESLPGGESLEAVLQGGDQNNEASNRITNTLLLPKQVAPLRHQYPRRFNELIRQNKFKLLSTGREAISANILYTDLTENIPARGRLGLNADPITDWLAAIELLGDSIVSTEYIEGLVSEANGFIRDGMPETFVELEASEETTQTLFGPQTQRSTPSIGVNPLNPSTRTFFMRIIGKLQRYLEPEEENPYNPNVQIGMRELIQLLNDEERNVLIVVQSNRDDDLRQFSSNIIRNVFNGRKRRGVNSPQVLFTFDEADEFMPREASETYALSKRAITILARRGRKFGMGVSIATQRVAYLDTSILAQLHTYFISKLPREYDRNTISEAFGLSEELLRRSLRFTKGQWLLVSYEATGLENVPLPVHFPNANDRLIAFLNEPTEEDSE